jgi:hypothetical protein
LKAQSSPRLAKSLDLIHEICRDQKSGGSQDFSLPTIGRLSQRRGGPAYQTMRNKNPQGERYQALIRAWADFSGGSTRKQTQRKYPQAFVILDKIDDPAVRQVVGGIIAANSRLKGEIQVLKQNADIVIDRRRIEPEKREPRTAQVFPTLGGLTEMEVEALRHAISDAFLEQEAWAVENNGRVKNGKGRTLFKPGFATAIRKVLDSYS